MEHTEDLSPSVSPADRYRALLPQRLETAAIKRLLPRALAPGEHEAEMLEDGLFGAIEGIDAAGLLTMTLFDAVLLAALALFSRGILSYCFNAHVTELRGAPSRFYGEAGERARDTRRETREDRRRETCNPQLTQTPPVAPQPQRRAAARTPRRHPVAPYPQRRAAARSPSGTQCRVAPGATSWRRPPSAAPATRSSLLNHVRRAAASHAKRRRRTLAVVPCKDQPTNLLGFRREGNQIRIDSRRAGNQ